MNADELIAHIAGELAGPARAVGAALQKHDVAFNRVAEHFGTLSKASEHPNDPLNTELEEAEREVARSLRFLSGVALGIEGRLRAHLEKSK